ncbi:MAG: hypothetical protein E3K32_03505 [wastewater metagenome]|nr:hypothetical protein [Candidatus Loosdrechtia aerotolerans]
MVGLKTTSVRISNYKCFGSNEHGYDSILPVNLIIGRNNTGKSTLLDLIDYVTAPKDLGYLGHNGKPPQISLSHILSEDDLRKVFDENSHGGPIAGNHWKFGHKWIGKSITWKIRPKGFEFININPPFGNSNFRDYESRLAEAMGNPFSYSVFKRLFADRDITPEIDSDELQIQSNGQGVTNAIQNFINRASLSSALVEDTFLKDLNFIFEPDGRFTDIVTQKLGDGRWEIYLEETEKGRVPLSHTGSGLKTIILVLAFLHLIPFIENRSLSNYLFGFEELENNLHPALQRRLLLYLRKKAVNQDCIFFLTTHSNIAIDLFSSDDKAQILHITHNGKYASAKRVTTYVENRGILDDLDVRASDLLQANGIIWLEGPSDRLYFNRWIELWSDGELKEGSHYQCVFYGGRLLVLLLFNFSTYGICF